MSKYKVKAALTGSVIAAIMAGMVLSHSVILAVSGTSYKSWKQYGESWSSMSLGSSSESVAQSGCAVTSAAMLMVKSGSVTDDSFTPATLVSYMNAHGGFNSNACMDFDKLSGYASGFTYCGKRSISGSQAEKAAKMQELMNEGYCLMAVVRYGGHFVAVDSVNGSEVTMMDPGSKSTSLFGKYSAAGVNELRLFKGAFSGASAAEVPEEVNDAAAAAPVTPIETLPADAVITDTVETVNVLPEAEAVPAEAVPVPEVTPTETAAAPVQEAEPVEIPIETETVIAEPVIETIPAAAEPEIIPIEEPLLQTAAPAATPSAPVILEESSIVNAGTAELFSRTTTADVHLRTQPDADTESLLVIPEGTAVQVLETSADTQWGKVVFNGKEGWISLKYAVL